MRSAERAPRLPALVAFVAGIGLAGCASLSEPLKAIQEAVVTPTANAIAPAPATSSAAAAAASAPAPARIEAPVPPAAQRTYDDALRLLRAGRGDDAERALRALTQSNPELGGPHANLGMLYRQAGKLKESATELEQAVKVSPEQPVYYNQLAITYRQQGQFAKSRTAYEKALELDPNYAAAVLNLGILHDLYLRDNAKALEMYDRYLALNAGKDATVTKWVADLKNRKPAQNVATKKEPS
jgi:Flp pilus assembly protein TadD